MVVALELLCGQAAVMDGDQIETPQEGKLAAMVP